MLKFLCALWVFLAGQILIAQTFTSTVNQAIPDDGSTVSFPLEVSGLPDMIDTTFGLESVCLNIDHTYNEDMNVKLMAPNGKTILLFGGIGGGSDNFTNTCLEGTGMSLFTGNAPYTGVFQSIGVLGNVNKGQNPNGTWTLVIHDTYAFADAGFLKDWSLTFGNAPAQPTYFVSSDLPIVKLTTVADPIVNDPKVPVAMQIIDNGPGQRNFTNQTDYVFEGKIMAEWQGFTGPYYPKKNYAFEVVDEQGNDLDTTLLGLPAESDWLFKAEYLDNTLIKNALTYEMARRMGVYAPRTQPCEIMLDDEYIGLYVLTEKVKRSKNRVDIAKLNADDLEGSELTGGYIFEMNINNNNGPDWISPHPPINDASNDLGVEFKYVYPKKEIIEPEQAAYLQDYVNDFENALLDDNFADPATGFRAFADEKSFINFLIVNEFSENYDSYGRSTYMVKEKDTDGGKLKCGPPWDYDRAYGYDAQGTGWVWQSTHPVWPFPFWWSRLWEDSTYRKRLACRWTMLRQQTLADQAFIGAIDSLALRFEEGQQRNFAVWTSFGVSYEENINALKSYLLDRLLWMDNTLSEQNVSLPYFYLPADTILTEGTVFDASQLIGNQYSYNWQPGPDTATISFPADGLYYLVATDIYGCSTRKSVQVTLQEPSSTSDFGAQDVEVSVFPNPFAAQLQVVFAQAPQTDFTLSLENKLGQRLLNHSYPAATKQLNIPTANLPSGQYMLRYTSGEKSWVVNVVRL